MLGLRWRMDCAQRWKKGQAAQSTTGVLKANSSQVRTVGGMMSRYMPPMASSSVAALNGSVHQKRRRKSVSSGFSSSSSEGSIGSSAMPHSGHVPGPSCTISGCIGQVYCVPGGACGAAACGEGCR